MTELLLYFQPDIGFWIEAVKTVGYPIVSALCFWLVIRQNNNFFQKMIERGEENEKCAQKEFVDELRLQRSEMMQFIRERDLETNQVLNRVAESIENLKDALRPTNAPRQNSHLKAI